MKVGIVGLGVVGNALREGFEQLGHDVLSHDIKFNTRILDLIESEIIYICVPTPSKENGEADISIVESVISELINIDYRGIYCLKSTVPPNTTNYLRNKFNVNIAFVPEFLRERRASEDFILNHDILAIGSDNPESIRIIIASHGTYPKETRIMSSTEAELLKYFSNSINSTKIIFANMFYDIAQKLNVNYDIIIQSWSLRNMDKLDYLNVNDKLRGFGGVCLPKDTKAIDFYAKSIGVDYKILESVLSDNSKLDITVFDGMR